MHRIQNNLHSVKPTVSIYSLLGASAIQENAKRFTDIELNFLKVLHSAKYFAHYCLLQTCKIEGKYQFFADVKFRPRCSLINDNEVTKQANINNPSRTQCFMFYLDNNISTLKLNMHKSNNFNFRVRGIIVSCIF